MSRAPDQPTVPERAVLPQAHAKEVLELLVAQLAAGEHGAGEAHRPPGADRKYGSNAGLWRDILAESVWPGASVTVEGFWLGEWLPLRPGLFHTPRAHMSRRSAQRFRLRDVDDSNDLASLRRALGRELPVDLVQRLHREAVNVYLPDGKARLLEGGIGSLRLRPRGHLGNPIWFMGASSTAVAHEGVVVALADDDHARVIEDIRRNGGLRCTLTGKLRYLPDEFDPLYRQLVGIPQLHLQVEQLAVDTQIDDVRFLASGAVLVRSDDAARSGHPVGPWSLADGVGSAFVSFPPGDPGSIELACEWLADTYVDSVMGGTVVTDFDEQVRRFPDAIFGLDAIRRGEVQVSEMVDVLHRSGADIGTVDQFKGRLQIVVGDQNINYGQAGAMGSGARAENLSFVQSFGGGAVPDAGELATELATLRAHLRAEATDGEKNEALEVLAEAERTAQEGDATGAVEKLSGLRRAGTTGRWALTAATTIGTTVAAGAIKVALGL